MNIIYEKQLIRITEKWKDRTIYLHHLGVISGFNTLYKLSYIEYNKIILLSDSSSNNYFSINLSYVYKMLYNKEKDIIKLFLDDDIVITLSCNDIKENHIC